MADDRTDKEIGKRQPGQPVKVALHDGIHVLPCDTRVRILRETAVYADLSTAHAYEIVELFHNGAWTTGYVEP